MREIASLRPAKTMPDSARNTCTHRQVRCDGLPRIETRPPVQSRVLVVDDDPKILSLLRRGLDFAGYAVDLAADGEEVREAKAYACQATADDGPSFARPSQE